MKNPTKKDVEALKKMIQEARPWYLRLYKKFMGR